MTIICILFLPLLFLDSQEYLIPAGTRRCNNVVYFLVATSDNVVTTLSKRCFSDVVTTTRNWRCYKVVFSTSTFRPGISIEATSWFWSHFPDENLKVLQYHYNFIFPKIYSIALRFHFLINIIYSVRVNAKRSFSWKICNSLPEQRKGIFDLV